jgi:hypothetical protein
MSSMTHVVTTGGGAGEVIAGPAAGAGPAGPTVDPAHTTTHFSRTRRTTMFQALYADLARAHRRRRHREYQRRLEAQAQQDLLLAMPRMLAR